MLTAALIWAAHPTEIETDLLDRGIDIFDWHQGTRDSRGRMKLSSRRLLALLTHSRPDAAYRLRGDWAEDTYILAAVYNELARLRVGYHIVHGGESYDPVVLRSPEQQRLLEETEAAAEEFRDDAEEQFYTQMGWT